MTKPDAQRILAPIIPVHSARLDGELCDDSTVYWRPHQAEARLEGDFTADQLEAIAVWMRANVDPTRE